MKKPSLRSLGPLALVSLPLLFALTPRASEAGGGMDYAATFQEEFLAITGSHFVTRRSRRFATHDEVKKWTDAETSPVVCGYPKLEGQETLLVELRLCRVRGTCEAFVIYAGVDRKALCTRPAQAKASLARAKAAFAKAGVDLERDRPIALKAEEGWTLPEDVLTATGIDDIEGRLKLVARRISRGPVCGVELVAPGANRLRLATEKKAGSCMSYGILGAAISSDRKVLALTTLGSWGRGHFESKGYPLSWIGARLLNTEAFRAHQELAYHVSAPLFEKATRLDPSWALAAFNLACARAQNDEPDAAMEALRRAIALQPARFRKKAAKDPDLDPIRKRAEFKALLETR